MSTLLFVNACPRGEDSRTLRLARTFLESALRDCPDTRVIRHDLYQMNLRPVNADDLAKKEELCDRFAWDDPSMAPALAFARADAVLIAAPYWDLSFPSALKIWVEHMYVRNLTFRYENDRPIGLCSGRASCYITTSGSLIGENDWGAGYLHAVLQTLGIPGFASFRAEALDLDGSDEEEILLRAEEDMKKAAPAWVRSWHEA